MRLILLVVGLIVVAAGVAIGVTFWQHRAMPTISSVSDTVTGWVSGLQAPSSFSTDNLPEGTQQQFATLTNRVGEVSQHAQQVLGTSIQVNEEAKEPLHQSALEHGRYVYCKQVVDSYEAREATASGDNN